MKKKKTTKRMTMEMKATRSDDQQYESPLMEDCASEDQQSGRKDHSGIQHAFRRTVELGGYRTLASCQGNRNHRGYWRHHLTIRG